ncbi:hypothetical protein N9N67_10075 [Bacteriovoracaceae bacterium]|nr:hypothetical protein [Bacteriovoracaceae bacterium]
MKETPLGKLERNNHLNHLVRVIPIITFAFAVQCMLIYHFTTGKFLAEFATIVGVGFIALIALLVFYDSNHHIILYKKHMQIYFALMGVNEDINYNDIENITTVDEESSFSTITLQLKDGRKYNLHFIDYPSHVITYILSLKSDEQTDRIKPSDLAA